jgi:hypothetical protein
MTQLCKRVVVTQRQLAKAQALVMAVVMVDMQ